jgi:hypothetical protein
MSYTAHKSSQKLENFMSPEQFELVLEAIIAGKYSWACVLILRFAGCNPLHYIPYRTYNRLMKEHRQARKLNSDPVNLEQPTQEALNATVRLKEVAYLEVISNHCKELLSQTDTLNLEPYQNEAFSETLERI